MINTIISKKNLRQKEKVTVCLCMCVCVSMYVCQCPYVLVCLKQRKIHGLFMRLKINYSICTYEYMWISRQEKLLLLCCEIKLLIKKWNI